MFSWVKKWFVKEEVKKEDSKINQEVKIPSDEEIYKPKERFIFKYWNGQKVIYADPMILYKRVVEKWADLSVDLTLAHSNHSEAPKGHTLAIDKVRKIFNVDSPEDIEVKRTLSDNECLQLLDNFLIFVGELKKNSSPSQTTSKPLEECKTISKEDLPTHSTSACG
jgi:hypothetical protein